MIELEIDLEAKTIQISNMQRVITEAAEGCGENEEDIGFAMKNFTDKTVELARTNYYLTSGYKRETLALKKTIPRKNSKINDLHDLGDSDARAKRQRCHVAKLKHKIATAKETIGTLANSEACDSEIMQKVKKEAAKRFKLQHPEVEHGGPADLDLLCDAALRDDKLEVLHNEIDKQVQACKTQAYYMQREEQGRYTSSYLMLWYDLASRIAL